MSIRNFVVSKFAFGAKCAKYSLTSINNIIQIMYRDKDEGTVYKAAQAYHFGMKKSGPSVIVYDWLSKQLYDYFNNGIRETIESFDLWHDQMCLEFVRQCSSIGFVVKYGFAQKFINIAFKYCYCFGDAVNFELLNKFEYCHTALDGYTYCPSTASRTSAIYLSYSCVCPLGLRLPFYTEEVRPTINIRTLSPWSKLSQNEYVQIQHNIREYWIAHPITYGSIRYLDVLCLAACSPDTLLTPFQLEFLIW